jgi:hypothetical protein
LFSVEQNKILEAFGFKDDGFKIVCSGGVFNLARNVHAKLSMNSEDLKLPERLGGIA